ncbi:MAG: glycosyltransferase [Bacteroidales bacterium]|nr:glycosyltransferase [Bacteroidales bacterium]
MYFYPASFELTLFIVFIGFLLSFVIQLIYYWLIFGKLAFYKLQDKLQFNQPISVLYYFNNEIKYIEENLIHFLEQDYDDFEVIVINESSDEDTSILLESLQRQYPRLKVINVIEQLNFFKGKNFPLSIGVKSALHEIIIVTEANCRPASPNWIHEIQGNFNKLTEIVLCYSTFLPKKTFINKLKRYDNLVSSMIYFSFALVGQPFMGIGRNLAYRKASFYKKKGLISIYTLDGGDDDLLVNNLGTKTNSRIEISHDSHILIEDDGKFLPWWRRKKRYFTTRKYYKKRHKIWLGLFSVSRLLFYSTFVVLMVYSDLLFFVVGIFLIRLLTQLIITRKCMSKLNEKELLVILPFYEIIMMFINVILRFSIIIAKKNKWK